MFLLSYAAVFLCGTVTGFFALANLAMVVMVRQEFLPIIRLHASREVSEVSRLADGNRLHQPSNSGDRMVGEDHLRQA